MHSYSPTSTDLNHIFTVRSSEGEILELFILPPPITLKLMTNPTSRMHGSRSVNIPQTTNGPKSWRWWNISSQFLISWEFTIEDPFQHWSGYIAGKIDCYSATLTTAEIDAKLYMTTSEHKHCRWCGSYIAYKNHEFVNLCFRVIPECQGSSSSSSPSSPRSDRSSISISCANSTIARWTKNYNTKGENEHPQSLFTPAWFGSTGAVPSPHIPTCGSTTRMISVMSCLLLCRPPVRKISKSVEFLILFCKIKVLRAFSTNSNSMLSMLLYVIFLPQDHLTSNHAQPTSCTSGSAASVTDFCADTLTSSGS